MFNKITQLLTLMVALSLVTFSAEAQSFTYNFAGGFVDTNPFGGQIGHEQAGAFGGFGAADRWIGIGNPTFGGAPLPVYGMRIQDAGQAGIFSVNNNGGNRDLEIQWGPEANSDFRLNFITDPFNNGFREIMVAQSDGDMGINKAVPAARLDVNLEVGASVRDGLGVEVNRVGGFGTFVRAEFVGAYHLGTGTTAGTQWGTYSRTSNGSAGTQYGVASFCNGTGGTTHYGVYGNASGATNNYSIYGIGSGGNFAGYFAGDVTVTGVFNNPSDRRLKNDIATQTEVMDQIMKLRPATYTYRKDGKFAEMQLASGEQHGFIAQEVEEVFPEMVNRSVHVFGTENMDPVEIAKNGEPETEAFEYKTVNYTAFIPVLTKGLQEQQAEIEAQNEVIAAQAAEIAELKAAVASISNKGAASATEFGSNVLYQNTPNPFSAQTSIRYQLAEGAQAELLVFDMNGRQLKAFSNLESGDNAVTLQGAELEAGMYFYSLIVNGEEVATKRMILTK